MHLWNSNGGQATYLCARVCIFAFTINVRSNTPISSPLSNSMSLIVGSLAATEISNSCFGHFRPSYLWHWNKSEELYGQNCSLMRLEKLGESSPPTNCLTKRPTTSHTVRGSERCPRCWEAPRPNVCVRVCANVPERRVKGLMHCSCVILQNQSKVCFITFSGWLN